MSESAIIVNGQPRHWPSAEKLSTLLLALKLPGSGIAVAVNDRIVPRSLHEGTTISAGDRVEIVQAAGGG